MTIPILTKKEDKLIGTESDFVLFESITFNY